MVVQIGDIVGSPLTSEPTKVICEDRELAPFANLKALHADIATRYDVEIAYPNLKRTIPASIDDDCFRRHALICGPTGTGKSRLLLRLLGHFWQQGASSVIIDASFASIRNGLSLARQVGIPEHCVFVLSPKIPGAVPRFPLFAQSLPIKQVVDNFVDMLEGTTSTQVAVRRHDFLVNTGLLVGSSGHDPSPDEWLMALQDSSYRTALAGQVGVPPDPFGWLQVERWMHELQTWSRAALADGVSPATRLMREVVNNEMLYGCLCALDDPNRSILRLEEFWQRQSLLFIHLDADIAGIRTTTLLAGLIVRSLFAAAKRVSNPNRQVYACLDELPELSRFVGDELARIVSQARSSHLHLMLACQFLLQLPAELRLSLTKNCSVQCAFRCDFEESSYIAKAAIAGSEPPVAQLTLSPLRTDDRLKAMRLSRIGHSLFDEHDRPLQLSNAASDRFDGSYGGPTLTVERVLALAAACDIARLYIHEPMTGKPVELHAYLKTLEGCSYWLEGQPLELWVAVPRAKPERIVRRSTAELTAVVAHCIERLPLQTALLRVDNRLEGVVRIADVPDMPFTAADEAYLCEILRVNGQSRSEILATLTTRTERMRSLTQGGLALANTGGTDASRW